MPTQTDPSLLPAESSPPDFEDPEVLRQLLLRQFKAGHQTWQADPDAEALLRFLIDRYRPLAGRHGHDPADVAPAAFEAMLNPATLAADDPWAVVTEAIRITLGAEDRAQGLLCSVNRARRKHYSAYHDAHRLPEHQLVAQQAWQHDPNLQRLDGQTDDNDASILLQATRVLVCLGWPPERAERVIDYVCGRLAEIGSRPAAYALLRRDRPMRATLNLPQSRWIALLRLTLGHPGSTGLAGNGILHALACGATLTQLLADPQVIAAAGHTRPPARGGQADG